MIEYFNLDDEMIMKYEITNRYSENSDCTYEEKRREGIFVPKDNVVNIESLREKSINDRK